MRPSAANRPEITIRSFTAPLPSLLSQRKCDEMLYCTQTGRDNFLFTSMIDRIFTTMSISATLQSTQKQIPLRDLPEKDHHFLPF